MSAGELREEQTNATVLNIGVLGYYGFGNLGDEMLLKTIRDFLAPHRVIAIPTAFRPSRYAMDRLNSFDYLILGGGGLFNRNPAPPFDTFDKWASQLQSPLSVLGLGVEHLDAKYIPAVHNLVDQADFFIVRDNESQRLIDHPKVQVAPDLTFFQPLSRSRIPKDSTEVTCGINLRPVNQAMEAWIEAVSELPYHLHALPFSLVPTYDDREPLAQLLGVWPEQTKGQDYEQLSVVIGTAFHVIALAIQAGIPAIAINYHAKVRRLMEEVGLAEFVLELDEAPRLKLCVTKALGEREAVRERMLSYTNSARKALKLLLPQIRSHIELATNAFQRRSPPVGTYSLVKVLVRCENTDIGQIGRTVSSCLAQTYPCVETVLVDCPNDIDLRIALQRTRGDFDDRITSVGGDQADEIFLPGADEYVTWVDAGAWFAEDALALLVKSLENEPCADLAHSNYFITHKGNICRKVRLHSSGTPKTRILGPSFLVNSRSATELWHNHKWKASQSVPRTESAVFLDQALFYSPANSSELSILYAAIAFGRGRTSTGQALIGQAICEEPSLSWYSPAFEEAFQVFLETGFARWINASPFSYLVEVCANLPVTTNGQRAFSRHFAGRAYLELAYMYIDHDNNGRACSSLLRALRHDPGLLTNRGNLWLLGDIVLGRSAVNHLHRRVRRW